MLPVGPTQAAINHYEKLLGWWRDDVTGGYCKDDPAVTADFETKLTALRMVREDEEKRANAAWLKGTPRGYND